MKFFQRKINGQVYKGELFEKLDILNKFNRTEEEWELVDQYQKTFPQLLLKDINDFIIDAEQLWNELGKPQGEYSKWFKRKIQPLFKLEKDYSRYDKLVGTIKNGNKKKVERHFLTLRVATHIAMSTGSDKNSSENIRVKGELVRDYFILIEQILKEYEDWTKERNPEKEGYKEMKVAIHDWCIRNGFDYLNEAFYSREGNMLNMVLTGQKAIDLRFIKNVKDNQTRDNLDIEVNKALADLQNNNIMLLANNMDFNVRQ